CNNYSHSVERSTTQEEPKGRRARVGAWSDALVVEVASLAPRLHPLLRCPSPPIPRCRRRTRCSPRCPPGCLPPLPPPDSHSRRERTSWPMGRCPGGRSARCQARFSSMDAISSSMARLQAASPWASPSVASSSVRPRCSSSSSMLSRLTLLGQMMVEVETPGETPSPGPPRADDGGAGGVVPLLKGIILGSAWVTCLGESGPDTCSNQPRMHEMIHRFQYGHLSYKNTEVFTELVSDSVSFGGLLARPGAGPRHQVAWSTWSSSPALLRIGIFLILQKQIIWKFY
ncbi:hypothetical protein ZWY2020_060010, partial [Hordeum vulgare]